MKTTKRSLASVAVLLLLSGGGQADAVTIIGDFFGSTNDLGNGTLTRHDAAGNTVFMQTGQGPTLVGIDGLRAQFPDNASAVWSAPGGQHAATWFFAASSTDPFEPVTPGDENNLTLVAGADAGTGGHLAALLPFTPPGTAYKVTADMIPEGGDVRDGVAIGFTSSLAILISHRFSTVRMADRILVLLDGRIAEAGTHDELVRSGGLYAELFQLQAAGYR